MKEYAKKLVKHLLEYREKKERVFVKKGSDRGRLY